MSMTMSRIATNGPRWLARCSNCPILRDAIERKVATGLAKTFPESGWLYVLKNPSWDANTVKFGMTRDLKKRMSTYNSSNQFDVTISMVFLCTDIARAETKLKTLLANHRIDQTRLEWISADWNVLVGAFASTIERDEHLTEACTVPIYKCISAETETEAEAETRVELERNGQEIKGLKTTPAVTKPPSKPRPLSNSEDGDEHVDDAEMDQDTYKMLFAALKGPELSLSTNFQLSCQYTPIAFQDSANHRPCKIAKTVKTSQRQQSSKSRLVYTSDLPRFPGMWLNAQNGAWVARTSYGTKSFSIKKFKDSGAHARALAVIRGTRVIDVEKNERSD